MAAGWGQTQPAAPAPNPSRTSIRTICGVWMGRLVSAVAASYTANAPGGWVGCIGVVDELVVDGVEKK